MNDTADMQAADLQAPDTRAARAHWPQLAIITAFWVYVALSNIWYARSMNAGLKGMVGEDHFAPWDARALQHLLLYPALLARMWASLKIRWQPAWDAVPMQLFVAAAFAVLGAPALAIAQAVLGHHVWDVWSADDHGLHPMHLFDSDTLALWAASATSMFLAYGFGLALVTGFSIYQRYADSQLKIAALEREFSAARLSALRLQLSPHTLFNLLHAIHGQIAWEPRAAQAMVVKLGDLLRRLLKAGERDFSSLADEMQFVRLYLELQQQRFADRLSIQIPERECLPAVWVPSLILQPLVENAVVHGLAGHDGPVWIRVEAAVTEQTLRLCITNTATGKSPGSGEGIGTRNVRERLAVQFGERASFSSGPAEAGIWRAEISLPAVRDVGSTAR
jgi:hypothetical protein